MVNKSPSGAAMRGSFGLLQSPNILVYPCVSLYSKRKKVNSRKTGKNRAGGELIEKKGRKVERSIVRHTLIHKKTHKKGTCTQ